MPPELHNDQELVLKKRARRRLVGAIALVLLMVIILPRILQDRAALASKEDIKISMPGANVVESTQAVVAIVETIKPEAEYAQAHSTDLTASDEMVIPEASRAVEALVASNAQAEVNAGDTAKLSVTKNIQDNVKIVQKVDVVSDEVNNNATKNIQPKSYKASIAESKVTVPKSPESKTKESKVTQPQVIEAKGAEAQAPKQDGSFTIQIGVFSELANVKQLQAKLKKAGFASHTEKINTAKGEKIRLKAGNFSSRQAAVSALSKLKSENLSGMVISND